METENTNQPQAPIQNPGQNQPIHSEDQPGQAKKIVSILAIVIALFAFGIGGYLLGTNRNQTNIQQSPTSSISTPQPSSSNNVVSTVNSTIADWKIYTSDELKLLFKYPQNFRVSDFYKSNAYPKSITLDFNQTEGASARWLRIEKIDAKDIQYLLNLQIGKSYKDPTITEIDVLTTRLPNQKIAGIDSYIFETNQGWEIPGPIKKILIPRDNSFYSVTITYSNLSNYNLIPLGPDKDVDYVKIFDQVLSTFQFN